MKGCYRSWHGQQGWDYHFNRVWSQQANGGQRVVRLSSRQGFLFHIPLYHSNLGQVDLVYKNCLKNCLSMKTNLLPIEYEYDCICMNYIWIYNINIMYSSLSNFHDLDASPARNHAPCSRRSITTAASAWRACIHGNKKILRRKPVGMKSTWSRPECWAIFWIHFIPLQPAVVLASFSMHQGSVDFLHRWGASEWGACCPKRRCCSACVDGVCQWRYQQICLKIWDDLTEKYTVISIIPYIHIRIMNHICTYILYTVDRKSVV